VHRKESPLDENADQKSLAWISIVLAGVALVSFITIMLYFYCTMRFAADFMPALTMLALVGFWQGYQLLSRWRTVQIPYALFALVLSAATIMISTLLAVSSYKERFVDLNPSLLHSLIAFFSR
jgi:uncharacterized membrane protein